MRLAAVGLDLRHQRRELVRLPPRDAGDIALAREAPRNRAAGRIARAHHQDRFLFAHAFFLDSYRI